MTQSVLSADAIFSPFEVTISVQSFPDRFTFPFDYQPHPLSLLAVEKLQNHLKTQTEWQHNFGLNSNDESPVIGKMFGVLVVETQENQIGYLAAFSGKLAGGNHHSKFVPPIFDGMEEGGFLNAGMNELTRINLEIKTLESENLILEKEIQELKLKRKEHSNALQNEIFDQYHFLNQAGETKSLIDIFSETVYKKPPAGAGECAAPKLLQYAFQENMKPLAMAEFWWGLSPKSDFWKHQQFYPACQEKCAPILAHMLQGIEMDEKPRY